MGALNCKSCGGDLILTGDACVVTCEYCGTPNTIPKVDDEEKVSLFNRANKIRRRCEFDKANSVYENIVRKFPNEAEAYWGLCLCKYGVEYVDDPKTGNKIPTLHRASSNSIFNEEDYKATIDKADVVARKQYESEATVIDRLNKEIMEIAQKEAPYDVFICYKETDEKNLRTKDSVRAQEIYDALEKNGYKVFFSRITLEGMLGEKYEPYIFSALNTARVMLVIGTNSDHFNAVWVRNEWSRYLSLMEHDRTKKLFPCYCDMDAYELPDEFRNLQAQDMSKVGFEQDLVRNIAKLFPERASGKAQSTMSAKDKDELMAKIDSISKSSGAETLEMLSKNAEKLISLERYTEADELYSKMTRVYPEAEEGWWGKIVCCTQNFTSYVSVNDNIKPNYITLQKVVDEQKMSSYTDKIKDYFRRVSAVEHTDYTIGEYNDAIKTAEQNIKDTEQKIREERAKANDYTQLSNQEYAELSHQRDQVLGRWYVFSNCCDVRKVTKILSTLFFIGAIVLAFVTLFSALGALGSLFSGHISGVGGMMISIMFLIILTIALAVTVGIARSTLKKVDIDIKDYGTFIPAALGNSKLVNYLENTKSSAYQEIRDLEGQMEHVNRELEENNSVVAENEKFFDSVIKDNQEYIKILRTALSVPKKDSQNYWFTIYCSLP